MPTSLTKEKKNRLYIIIAISSLFLISIAIYFFIASSPSVEESLLPSAERVEITNIQRIKVEKLDIEVFKNENFKNLIEYKFKNIPIEELDIGNDNPFEPR